MTSTPALVPGSRRRPRKRSAGATPYLLIAPAMLIVATVLAYPLYQLVSLSFQKYNLPQLIAHQGEWIGLANYRDILGSAEFWVVVARTIAFTAACVGLTIGLGTLIAMLVERLGSFMRLLVNAVLVAVWAIPWLVSVALWQWMVDYEFGVLNWLLTRLHLGNFTHHNWFDNPVQGFAVIIGVVVWGALPFVVITIYAGLTQVPTELYEAAALDGAGTWRQFRTVTWPVLKPIFIIVTSLSVIWDFQVFNQVWVMLQQHPGPEYYLLSVYSFMESFRVNHYGLGSAIAVVMALLMLCVGFFYIRQMVRLGEVES